MATCDQLSDTSYWWGKGEQHELPLLLNWRTSISARQNPAPPPYSDRHRRFSAFARWQDVSEEEKRNETMRNDSELIKLYIIATGKVVSCPLDTVNVRKAFSDRDFLEIIFLQMLFNRLNPHGYHLYHQV